MGKGKSQEKAQRYARAEYTDDAGDTCHFEGPLVLVEIGGVSFLKSENDGTMRPVTEMIALLPEEDEEESAEEEEKDDTDDEEENEDIDLNTRNALVERARKKLGVLYLNDDVDLRPDTKIEPNDHGGYWLDARVYVTAEEAGLDD